MNTHDESNVSRRVWKDLQHKCFLRLNIDLDIVAYMNSGRSKSFVMDMILDAFNDLDAQLDKGKEIDQGF